MTLREAGEYLLMECQARHLTHDTVEFYRARLAAIERILGNPDLKDVGLADLRRVLVECPPKSAHHNYVAIKRIFSLLISEELITVDPSRKLRSPRQPKPVINPLSTEDIAKVFKAAKQDRGFIGVRDSIMFATLIATGIRRAEICGLKDGDVNLKDGFMVINGKGRKQRIVPIPSKLKLMLARWLMVRQSSKVGDRSEAFFKDRLGRPIDPDALSRTMRRLGKRAGIKLWTHLCRHSFATQFMSNDGSDVLSLQAICGWSDLQMATTYAHAQLPKLQRSMESFSPVNEF
ncbi:MAG: tyrosine-type recombinase/integrase [Vulcanimicrobiaceae bacterium]